MTSPLASSFRSLQAIISLTQLTSLHLSLNLEKFAQLDIPTGLSTLQCLQSLGIYNHSFSPLGSPDAGRDLLRGISTNLTRLGLLSVVDGFPDVAVLRHLQMLESSRWGSARSEAIASSNLTLSGTQLTWLQCLECSEVGEDHVPAFRSISRLTSLQTLMISAEGSNDFLEDEFFWSADLLQTMLQPLQSLTALQLCGMEMQTLPACLATLRLSALAVADNQLLGLPPGSYLASLEFLDISWNSFESVPVCLLHCTCLQHLLVSSRIADFHGVLPQLHVQQPDLENIAAAQAACRSMYQLEHCSMTMSREGVSDCSRERPVRNIVTLPP